MHEAGAFTIEILDVAGRQVVQTQQTSPGDGIENEIIISKASLGAGAYTAIVTCRDQKKILKLIRTD